MVGRYCEEVLISLFIAFKFLAHHSFLSIAPFPSYTHLTCRGILSMFLLTCGDSIPLALIDEVCVVVVAVVFQPENSWCLEVPWSPLCFFRIVSRVADGWHDSNRFPGRLTSLSCNCKAVPNV